MSEEAMDLGNKDLDSLIELARKLATPSREAKAPLTASQVKALFYQYGIAQSAWEAHFGFNSGSASRMINGSQRASRGESHKLAVLLGLKVGTVLEGDGDRSKKMSAVLGDAVRLNVD